jgi:hypothetical protein
MSRIRDPHVLPITDFVDELRRERSESSIPYVDPDMGGVSARVLFLFQDPGPMASAATGGSGLLSPSNDDPSANTMCQVLHEAGLSWSEISAWNAVPWHTGGTNTAANREAGVEALCRLVSLMPKLSVVVTCGRQATASWEKAVRLRPELSRYSHIATLHPSDRGLTMGGQQFKPVGRAQFVKDVAAAKEIAGIRK